ncbi:hypothetical protein [Leisingera sp. S232]|uniref:hypothetical protein n=1 Tax=Leisingera sp. S232 TaxID=3415132 RepID=UPI00086A2FE0|nr:hypothetical protein AB838_06005 [Rhodobacteraceae bacterium (ex Bugula neritina AB1)]
MTKDHADHALRTAETASETARSPGPEHSSAGAGRKNDWSADPTGGIRPLWSGHPLFGFSPGLLNRQPFHVRGRADAVIDFDLQPYDVPPVSPVISTAGKVVTNLNGQPDAAAACRHTGADQRITTWQY